MDFLAGLLIAVKSLVFVGGYVSTDKSTPTFTSVEIITKTSQIAFSCELEHAFSSELAKLSVSGTTIPINLFAELRCKENDSLLIRVIVKHSILFDLSSRSFTLQKSYTTREDTTTVIDTALRHASTFIQIPLINRNQISAQRSYYISIYAILGKATMEAMNNNIIDLMFFWRYKRPFVRTQAFPGASLAQKP